MLAVVAIVVAVLLVSQMGSFRQEEDQGEPAAPKGGGPAAIPLTVGRWAGRERPVLRTVKEVLGTDDIIMRPYVRGRDTVQLAVILTKVGKQPAHRPEVTYDASGYDIEEKEADSFATRAGRRISTTTLKRADVFGKSCR